MSNYCVEVTSEALCLDRAYHFLRTTATLRASVFHTGNVDAVNNGRRVASIYYQSYAPLTEKILCDICEEAKNLFPTVTAIYVAHPIDLVKAGELCTIVAVAATKKWSVASEACQYILDQLRCRVPLWKCEHYLDGGSDWLPGYNKISYQQDGE